MRKAIADAKFKVGEEVWFKRGQFDEDIGVITKVEIKRNEVHYWATWADGQHLHTSEKYLTKASKLEKALS